MLPLRARVESDVNEEELYIPQSSIITGTSLSDCLVSYPGHSISLCKEAVGLFCSPCQPGKNVCVRVCVYVCACVFECSMDSPEMYEDTDSYLKDIVRWTFYTGDLFIVVKAWVEPATHLGSVGNRKRENQGVIDSRSNTPRFGNQSLSFSLEGLPKNTLWYSNMYA